MKLFKYLNEASTPPDYITSVKYCRGKVSYPIYKNVSTSSIKQMSKEGTEHVKAIRIGNDVYVFDAEMMHIYAYEALKDERIKIGRNILCGGGLIEGNKLKFEDLYDGAKKSEFNNLKWLNSNDKWLDKWFTEPFLKTAKTLINDLYMPLKDIHQ